MSRRTARGRPNRNPGRLRLALIVVALSGLVACQATPGPESATPSNGAPAPPAPPADVDAIRATIDAVNATAGGPVADQQAQLLAHVDPARRDETQHCPTATTTVRLAPVEPGLRELATTPDASAAPASAGATAPDASGTVYGLPTLIRIFSGNRLIGTDLTTLRLVVRDTGAGPEAFLTPFCVN